jgi:hypothetical protein
LYGVVSSTTRAPLPRQDRDRLLQLVACEIVAVWRVERDLAPVDPAVEGVVRAEQHHHDVGVELTDLEWPPLAPSR